MDRAKTKGRASRPSIREGSPSRVPLLVALALGIGALGFGAALALRPDGLAKLAPPKGRLNQYFVEAPPADWIEPEPRHRTDDPAEPQQAYVLEPSSIGAWVHPLDPPSLTPRPGIGTGTLTIECTPPATVFIDGMELPRGTPISEWNVWAGRHRIGLRTADGLHEFPVEIVDGETTTVFKDLRAESATDSLPLLTLSEAHEVIDADRSEVPACTVLLARNDVVRDQLILSLVVTDGVVETAQVESSSFLDRERENCVLDQVMDWRFPEGRTGKVTVPFRARRSDPRVGVAPTSSPVAASEGDFD